MQMNAEKVKKAPDSLAVQSDKVYESFHLTYKDVLTTKERLPISVVPSLKNPKNSEQIESVKQVNPQLAEADKVAKAEVEFRAIEIERLKNELSKALAYKHEEILEQITQQELRQIEALSVVGEVMRVIWHTLKTQGEYLQN